jgi:hypothetical protein
MTSDAAVRPKGPSVRPLGYMAVGCGVLSVLLAATFFLSLLALPPGALAVGLGLAARSEDSTRKMGTVALVLGLVALLGATLILGPVLVG